MSSGLTPFGLEDYKFLTENLCYKLWVLSLTINSEDLHIRLILMFLSGDRVVRLGRDHGRSQIFKKSTVT